MKIKFKIEGPFQAWGVPSEYGLKGTAYHPTKRGIIGLIGCCMGLAREDEKLEILQNKLEISVETVKEGSVLVDYQTVSKADGSKLNAASGGFAGKYTEVLQKAYLDDASFIVHLEGSDEVVKEIYYALESPEWVPYLGRKNCLPTEPIIPEFED